MGGKLSHLGSDLPGCRRWTGSWQQFTPCNGRSAWIRHAARWPYRSARRLPGAPASSLRLEMSTHLARLRDLLTADGDAAADLTAAVSVPYLSVAAASHAIGERIRCRPLPGGQWEFSYGWGAPIGGTDDMDAVATAVRTALLAESWRVTTGPKPAVRLRS